MREWVWRKNPINDPEHFNLVHQPPNQTCVFTLRTCFWEKGILWSVIGSVTILLKSGPAEFMIWRMANFSLLLWAAFEVLQRERKRKREDVHPSTIHHIVRIEFSPLVKIGTNKGIVTVTALGSLYYTHEACYWRHYWSELNHTN